MQLPWSGFMAWFERWPLAFTLASMFAAIGIPPVSATEPEIRNLSVRGLQVKGTTPLTIDGDGFGTKPKLLLPFPANVTLKPGGNDKQATFDIALGDDVTPGYHQLRLVSENGVTLPAVIAVDRLPQRPFGPSIEQLPVALHGSVSGSNVLETAFTGKSGQKVMIEVEAKRLGGALRPVIHLYSPKRLQLGWAWGVPALHGDARLEATLPEDGAYRITLHDAEYQAPVAGHFRLRVGQWAYVDRAFPAQVSKEIASVELIGSQSAKADLPTARNARWLLLPWPKDGTWSGPRPYAEASSRTELLEQPDSGKPQELPAGQVAVSGRLASPYEEDRYRVAVTPGSKIRFDVYCERLGSPIDAALVIRNDMGADLSRVEDGPGTLDPSVEFTVPANVSALVLAVVDAQGRGGPNGLYRLAVSPVVVGGDNEFELITSARRLTMSSEGKMVIPVLVERRGYSGPIDLSATALPSGVKLEGTQIPPGADGTLVTVTSSSAAVNAGLTTWQGKSADGRERVVVQKNHPMEKLQPWLATELAVAGSAAKGKDLIVEWKDAKPDDSFVLGRRRSFNIKVTRTGPATPVRITLVTSQLPVLANNQPDPNRTIRLERALELAANVSELEVPLLIPAELSSEVYDIAIQAETLTANKQGATALGFTPVRRLAVNRPVALKLDGPARIDVKTPDKGAPSVEIAGTVERFKGIDGDVQVTLTGLPPGAQAPPVTVKAGTISFKLKVTLAANTPAGEIKELKLNASIIPEPKQPNQRAKSKDVEVTLNVLAAKK
jgi:hypothetical protein